MFKWTAARFWSLCVALCCTSLVGYAFYNQFVDYLEPCPLCILQRLMFIWMGIVALLALIHHPGRTGQRIYAWLMVSGAFIGALIAGRHIWLQSLPADEVPECGPGLNYMLQTLPLSEVVKELFYGSGSCAEVKWSFLGMSMPMWTLAWYVGLSAATLWVVYRLPRR